MSESHDNDNLPESKLSAIPSVSVLMPIRNEVNYIERSLQAIFAQDYGGSIEILVIDGMSDDGTQNRVRDFARSNSQVRFLENPVGIVSTALNIGAAKASGEIFVRVDGRALIPPNYIKRCVQLLTENGAVSAGGTQVPVSDTRQGAAIAAAMRSPFGVGTARFRFARGIQQVDTVYLGAWPRSAFEQIGGFNEKLVRNQDYEFNYRLRRAGGKIIFSPDLRVQYYGRPTLGSLWRQYFDYGFWKARVVALHPHSTRPRHLIAPIFVAGLPVGALLGWLLGGVWLWLFSSALALYGTLIATFSIIQAARHGWANLVLLPIIFLTLHLAWGAGFWSGILRWWLIGKVRSG